MMNSYKIYFINFRHSHGGGNSESDLTTVCLQFKSSRKHPFVKPDTPFIFYSFSNHLYTNPAKTAPTIGASQKSHN